MFEAQRKPVQVAALVTSTANLTVSVTMLAVRLHHKGKGTAVPKPLFVGLAVAGSVTGYVASKLSRSASFWEGAEACYTLGEVTGRFTSATGASKPDTVEADGAALATEHDDTDDDGVPVDSGNVFEYLENLAEEFGLHTPQVDGNLAVKEEYDPLTDLPTFADDLHAGRATVHDMDKYVDVWNRLNAKGVNVGTIPQFLGLSQDEYRGIVKQLNRNTDDKEN